MHYLSVEEWWVEHIDWDCLDTGMGMVAEVLSADMHLRIDDLLMKKAYPISVHRM